MYPNHLFAARTRAAVPKTRLLLCFVQLERPRPHLILIFCINHTDARLYTAVYYLSIWWTKVCIGLLFERSKPNSSLFITKEQMIELIFDPSADLWSFYADLKRFIQKKKIEGGRKVRGWCWGGGGICQRKSTNLSGFLLAITASVCMLKINAGSFWTLLFVSQLEILRLLTLRLDSPSDSPLLLSLAAAAAAAVVVVVVVVLLLVLLCHLPLVFLFFFLLLLVPFLLLQLCSSSGRSKTRREVKEPRNPACHLTLSAYL